MVLKLSWFGEDFEKDPTPLEYVFKDYIDIDGIKMPLSVGMLEFGKSHPKVEWWARYTYRFNVAFDPDVFVHPPPPAFDAWRPKKHD